MVTPLYEHRGGHVSGTLGEDANRSRSGAGGQIKLYCTLEHSRLLLSSEDLTSPGASGVLVRAFEVLGRPSSSDVDDGNVIFQRPDMNSMRKDMEVTITYPQITGAIVPSQVLLALHDDVGSRLEERTSWNVIPSGFAKAAKKSALILDQAAAKISVYYRDVAERAAWEQEDSAKTQELFTEIRADVIGGFLNFGMSLKDIPKGLCQAAIDLLSYYVKLSDAAKDVLRRTMDITFRGDPEGGVSTSASAPSACASKASAGIGEADLAQRLSMMGLGGGMMENLSHIAQVFGLGSSSGGTLQDAGVRERYPGRRVDDLPLVFGQSSSMEENRSRASRDQLARQSREEVSRQWFLSQEYVPGTLLLELILNCMDPQSRAYLNFCQMREDLRQASVPGKAPARGGAGASGSGAPRGGTGASGSGAPRGGTGGASGSGGRGGTGGASGPGGRGGSGSVASGSGGSGNGRRRRP
ncbi:unnamed protein product [Amoebophrya sp. A25]|nr:unnamed protein product [Amoebophrya sp. A25]|eukprot:GSA25T00024506001.1